MSFLYLICAGLIFCAGLLPALYPFLPNIATLVPLHVAGNRLQVIVHARNANVPTRRTLLAGNFQLDVGHEGLFGEITIFQMKR